jgi:hypothetical protein
MRITALLLLVMIAGGGFVGGISLLMDSDGSALGLNLAMLPGWYRGDYFWAGSLLLIGFGLVPAIAATLLFIHPAAGWLAVLLVGAGLVVWMLVQILMIGLMLPQMQIFFVLIGATLVLLGVRGVSNYRRFERTGTL